MNNNSINQLLETLNSTNLEDVKQNLRSFKYQNNEVPHVRKWIQEQERKLKAMPYKASNPPCKSTKKICDRIKLILYKIPKLLYEIVIGVIIVVLGACVLWGINHYWHLNLKP